MPSKQSVISSRLCKEGLHCDGRLKWVKRLLAAWRLELDNYAKVTDDLKIGDYPHWYNERASVGFLALAVRRLHGAAIEEFRQNRLREGKLGAGRCDLWFAFDKGYPCFLEAKHLWAHIDPGKKRSIAKDTLRRIRSERKQATDSLLQAHGALMAELPGEARKSRLLTAVFVTAYSASKPWKAQFKSKRSASAAIESWLAGILPAAGYLQRPLACAVWWGWSETGWATYPVVMPKEKEKSEVGRKVAPIQLLVISEIERP